MIFAAPRCSELPELGRIRDLFEKKYGKDFVSAAVDLRPDACVNNLVSFNIYVVHNPSIVTVACTIFSNVNFLSF